MKYSVIKRILQHQKRCIQINIANSNKKYIFKHHLKTPSFNTLIKYKFCSSNNKNNNESLKLDAQGKPYEEQFYVDRSNPKYESYTFPKRGWTDKELDVKITHIPPETTSDKAAYYTVRSFRFAWDLFSGYTFGHRYGWFKWGENMWLRRIIFLESIAGVPGFVFGMVRHLKSLRKLERDRGWINTLMSEAENERIHLLTAMDLYKPGRLFRYGVVIAQGIMCNFLFLAYLVNSRYCHRFVGYIEEEACITYTGLLKDIDADKLPRFKEPASTLAIKYWKLHDNATWRDVFDHIRADEAHHREVNHTLAPLSEDSKAVNPYRHVNVHNRDEDSEH